MNITRLPSRLASWLRVVLGLQIQWSGGWAVGSRDSVMRPVDAADRHAERPRFSAFPETGNALVTPPIVYRPYRPGDERSIMQGFNETFRLCRDTEYWRWKFCGDDKPVAMLAVDAKGHVQAQAAAIRLDWVMDGIRTPVAQICDLFSRRQPQVVRARIMMKTMEAFHETYSKNHGMALLYGFPNRTALRLHGNVRPTFESARPVTTYRRILHNRPRASFDVGGISKYTPSQGALDELWQRAGGRYQCAAPRDSSWFSWRFTQRPDVSDYLPLIYIRDDGSLAAWLVLRRDGNVLWVCDLVWDGDSPDVLKRLDDAVTMESIRLGIQENAIWLQGDNEVLPVLLEHGWSDRSTDQAIHMVMHVYDHNVDPEEIYSKLYLTAADSDLI